ncbi:hypothetical protein BC830DRAFT_135788 [Chytriomyces sp. MP71]|nr:hypothetical protein BC830DRAFT_135788 [Chytriomyces sp. MP71]
MDLRDVLASLKGPILLAGPNSVSKQQLINKIRSYHVFSQKCHVALHFISLRDKRQEPETALESLLLKLNDLLLYEIDVLRRKSPSVSVGSSRSLSTTTCTESAESTSSSSFESGAPSSSQCSSSSSQTLSTSPSSSACSGSSEGDVAATQGTLTNASRNSSRLRDSRSGNEFPSDSSASAIEFRSMDSTSALVNSADSKGTVRASMSSLFETDSESSTSRHSSTSTKSSKSECPYHGSSNNATELTASTKSEAFSKLSCSCDSHGNVSLPASTTSVIETMTTTSVTSQDSQSEFVGGSASSLPRTSLKSSCTSSSNSTSTLVTDCLDWHHVGSKLSAEIMQNASILRTEFNILPLIVFPARYLFQNLSSLSRRARRRHLASRATLSTLLQSAPLAFIIVTDPFSSRRDAFQTREDDEVKPAEMHWILHPLPDPPPWPQSDFFNLHPNHHLFGAATGGSDRMICLSADRRSWTLRRVVIQPPPELPMPPPDEPDPFADPCFVAACLRRVGGVVPKPALLLRHLARTRLDAQMAQRGPRGLFAALANGCWVQLRGLAGDKFREAKFGMQDALRNASLWHALVHAVSDPLSNVVERRTAGMLLLLLMETYGMDRKKVWQTCCGVSWLVNTVVQIVKIAVGFKGLESWTTRLERDILEEKIRLLRVSGGLLAQFSRLCRAELLSGSLLMKSLRKELVLHAFAALSECCILAAGNREIGLATTDLIASFPNIILESGDSVVTMNDWNLIKNIASKYPCQKSRDTAYFMLRKFHIIDIKCGRNPMQVAKTWQRACTASKMHPCMMSLNPLP